MKLTIDATCGIILGIFASFLLGVCLTLGKGENLGSKTRWALKSKGQQWEQSERAERAMGQSHGQEADVTLRKMLDRRQHKVGAAPLARRLGRRGRIRHRARDDGWEEESLPPVFIAFKS